MNMNKQTGSALIISLLMLLVMTLLGVTSMSTSTLEEKMAANDRNQKVAFQNSETTLVASEIAVNDADWQNEIYRNTRNVGAADPHYNKVETIAYGSAATWTAGGSCTVTTANNCYIYQLIDEGTGLGDDQGKMVSLFDTYGQSNDSNTPYAKLNITARSTDANQITTATVQSTVRKLALIEK